MKIDSSIIKHWAVLTESEYGPMTQEELESYVASKLIKAGENDIYIVEKVVFQNTYSKGTKVPQ